MKITALDLGASTGVAFGITGMTPVCETWNLRAPDLGERAVILAETLAAHASTFHPDRIYIEAPPNLTGMVKRGTNMDTLQSLYGYSCIARMVGAKLKIVTVLIGVQVVRKHFLGFMPKAGMGKEAVMARCHQLRWKPHNQNESDACALWDYACALEDATVHIRERLRQSVSLSVV